MTIDEPAYSRVSRHFEQWYDNADHGPVLSLRHSDSSRPLCRRCQHELAEHLVIEWPDGEGEPSLAYLCDRRITQDAFTDLLENHTYSAVRNDN